MGSLYIFRIWGIVEVIYCLRSEMLDALGCYCLGTLNKVKYWYGVWCRILREYQENVTTPHQIETFLDITPVSRDRTHRRFPKGREQWTRSINCRQRNDWEIWEQPSWSDYICTISLDDDEAELEINEAFKPDIILGVEDISACATVIGAWKSSWCRTWSERGLRLRREPEGSVLLTDLLHRKWV